MKKIVLILLTAFVFAGCFRENEAGCPTDMRLRFVLNDEYETGDYDSRIGNDVFLYVFKDKILTYSVTVPYDRIKNGQEFVLRKTPEISGNLDIVAWAVKAGEYTVNIPSYSIGDIFEEQIIKLAPATRAGLYHPSFYYRFLATAAFEEAIDEPTSHTFEMQYGICRIEVNIVDRLGSLSGVGADPYILLGGTMSQMNLEKEGVGQPASVKTFLNTLSGDVENYSTGRFGVLPSSEGQTVSVQILNAGNLLTTLTVPRESLPRGAEAGGLLIFDYVMDAPEFFLTIDGFTQKIVIVDEI